MRISSKVFSDNWLVPIRNGTKLKATVSDFTRNKSYSDRLWRRPTSVASKENGPDLEQPGPLRQDGSSSSGETGARHLATRISCNYLL